MSEIHLPFPEPEKPAETLEIRQARETLGLSRCNFRLFTHQVIGIQALLVNPFFLLADEMGAAKSAQVIVAAQILFERGIINRVIVIAPASVRNVWFDPELGELAKHLWTGTSHIISEYHAKIRQWKVGSSSDAPLKWIVGNYEFIRNKDHLKKLLLYCSPKTLLVLDESSAVKSGKAAQTKACMKLRKQCGRVVLLNGTPIANTPLDMLSQGNMLHPSILDCTWLAQFRDRYIVMDPRVTKFPKILGYKNIDDLQRRFAPYVLRRLKKDCLDLPEKLSPVTLTATLTPATWKSYRAMRDEMVVWLTRADASVANQAAVKAMRLSQITSGFLGGVERVLDDDIDLVGDVQEIGREKLDVVLHFFANSLEADPNLKLLVWVRFRQELTRMIEAMTLYAQHKYPGLHVGSICGGQKKADREHAIRLLDPRTAPSGPVFVGGTYGTGSLGLNLTACHVVVNCSTDFSLYKALQSADRVHRPGQVHAVSYYDVIAEGPQGQKTIDHHVVKALRQKQSVADFTTSAWLNILRDE